MKMDGETVQTRFVVKRHPERGAHPVWYVLDSEKDTLICACAYLKGAVALCEKLWDMERKMRTIEPFQNFSFTVRA